MDQSGIQIVNWWRKSDRVADRLVDWLVITFGITLAFGICWMTVENPYLSLLWSLVLCFYFFFYRRMAQAIYWSANTFHLLRRHEAKATPKAGSRKLPHFHLLIAAYDAGVSIGPVIKAAANQDYPREQFSIWIITEHSEQLKRDNQVKELIRTASTGDTDPTRISSLIPFWWRCISQELSTLDEWIEDVTAGRLKSYLRYPNVGTVLLQDLLYRLLFQDGQTIRDAGTLEALRLSKRESQVIQRELERIEARVTVIAGDFARLLGSSSICLPADLAGQLISQAVHSTSLNRIGKRLCLRWADPKAQVEFPNSETIKRTARLVNASTQETIRQTVDKLHLSNVRHLDPSNRGFKPGALNAAYRQIRAEGLLERPENDYFIIIDADSLLPAHALKAVSRELREEDVPAIMQMTSIPTANFFNGGWYSKFISFADAIGAVGKWARSTRRQLKPDLQAGSGVVVPATLSQYIETQTGFAWDEGTLTEDARLIIGQFGMMNGVRNKTRMAPVFLLEAVPAAEGFFQTYRSFWNQRRRWSAGGFDEFFYLLSAPSWLLHTQFNSSTKRWEQYSPKLADRIKIRLRQLHRSGLWLWDHFIWGIGGFIVLTHWWLISITIGAPSGWIRGAGFLALLLTPLLFIAISGRQLSWFVPGGLSLRRKCLLYLQSYVAIWLYCLPAVATQLICLLGFRSKIVEWKPTQKPQYQLGSPVKVGER